MVASEKQIEKNNLEAHSAVLTQEIIDRTSELNSITKSVDEAKAILIESNIAKKEVQELSASETKKLDDARTRLSEERIQYESERSAATSSLSEILAKIKRSDRKLEKINFSCLNAQTDLESINKQIQEAREALSPLTDLVIKYEEIKESIRLAEIEKSRIDNSIAEAKRKSEVDLKEAREQLSDIRNEAQTKSMERDAAAYDLKSYTDQLYTSMNDYQTIRSRLEGVWNKTFPELEIPLTL